MTTSELISAVSKARVYDLGQPYYPGMPHHPNHPPFLYGLTKKHGDLVTPGGVSSAAEAITLGGHVGTHIDGLAHFSCGGKLFGGHRAAEVQDYLRGFTQHAIDEMPPILRRGVFLDIAGLAGIDEMPEDFVITPEHLDGACKVHGVEVRRGDVVLLRTGWARLWDDAARYIREARGPGPELEGARWLSSRGVFAAGSDTIAFERVPARDMPAHVHLIVESGIHILEALDLEKLAADSVHEFLFIAAPMKIRGGTGAPLRPLALAL
jgi:kynurenine formamidase